MDLACLPDAVGTILGLSVHGRIPVGVVENDLQGGREGGREGKGRGLKHAQEKKKEERGRKDGFPK